MKDFEDTDREGAEHHMSDQHKPLTAAEIEELRELEARATGGEWRVGEPDANGQPTVSDKYIELLSCWHHSVESIEKEAHANAALIAAMRNALPRLLSMLTTPTDAAVREAVESLEYTVQTAGKRRLTTAIVDELRTLLRAVQSPRLTREQVEAVKIAETLLTDTMSYYGDCEHDVGHCICKYHSGVFNLRAAFPEAFGKEG